ncbi:hypothetical protein GWI33_018918 [Rhynchophorus ferrugineus]|uniref:Uncharacterized protein n=1 Tax=Rhynchophorus ferrugineus TaxID=354439 RepID=A0A834M7J4_RHYFE|nr:hypothetical protein GWI33_018918 [Rhynchophorus ferrugineus]
MGRIRRGRWGESQAEKKTVKNGVKSFEPTCICLSYQYKNGTVFIQAAAALGVIYGSINDLGGLVFSPIPKQSSGGPPVGFSSMSLESHRF